MDIWGIQVGIGDSSFQDVSGFVCILVGLGASMVFQSSCFNTRKLYLVGGLVLGFRVSRYPSSTMFPFFVLGSPN